jgi:hypothetical protein
MNAERAKAAVLEHQRLSGGINSVNCEAIMPDVNRKSKQMPEGST